MTRTLQVLLDVILNFASGKGDFLENEIKIRKTNAPSHNKQPLLLGTYRKKTI